ncbi:hypothetical protein GBA52_013990 [Prunus armeniaca]|nr:hypothetical protein GBA52_013990 [Prunus armeniaca]
MPIQVCAAAQSKPEIIRRTANFPPSIWGDWFMNYDSQDIIKNAQNHEEVEELREVVRRQVFTTSVGDFSHQLKLIDAIESEIEEALERMHAAFHDHDFSDDEDLYNVALGFRLLRQHGYKSNPSLPHRYSPPQPLVASASMLTPSFSILRPPRAHPLLLCGHHLPLLTGSLSLSLSLSLTCLFTPTTMEAAALPTSEFEVADIRSGGQSLPLIPSLRAGLLCSQN